MTFKEKIKDEYLDVQACEAYKEYGISTIEDRAIVGTFDGLKPVMRRAVWALHTLGLNHKVKTVKAALMVGDILGKYHPHGDTSVYDAMVGATQMPQPLIDGSDSNWGTMTEEAAAYRYTTGKLTKYSDLVFFDKFYMPIMVLGPNFDDSRREPVNLVTLLPNGLLNGNFGICPGVNTRTPAFTLPSMVKVLKAVLANKGVCDASHCADLEWVSDYGGKLDKSKHNKASLKEFFKTGVGSFDWVSSYKLDDKGNSIRFDRFAPLSFSKDAPKGKKSPLEKLISDVEAIPGVQSINDDSEKTDPFRQAYIVRFQKTCRGAARETAIKKIVRRMSSRMRYDVKVTDRTIDMTRDKVVAALRPITVPQLITEWVANRLLTEQAACSYWIVEREKEIRWNEVMRLAIAKLDFIFRCVKDEKLNDAQLVTAIAKGIKISEEEADQVLKRNLRQLRKMEDKALEAKIKELNKNKKELEGRRKNPAKYVVTDLDRLVKELA